MKKNEIIQGFRLDNVRELKEIKAQLHEFTHVKTLAKLIWIKRDDDNKTFGIAFKTIPNDDTGVFHILEHSTLNGSKNFPLKEPFVDLLKGSLQTFLNAMTYPDKTVYPVSSRNDKDFINLMRVYLDAVFNPLCISNPNIFYQEGWHYEFKDMKGPISYKGVVYNEMKGAFSSPERLAGTYLLQQLFPNSPYKYVSGGDPEHIYDLTYEKFVETHQKFYHPTNSRIFLDGNMNIEEVLGIINDEYLSHYDIDMSDIVIDKQQPIIAQDLIKEYAISENDDPSNKNYIDYGFVTGMFDDYQKNIAFHIIASVLTDSNQSILKKAILAKDLAQDIDFTIDEDSIYQPFVELLVTNAKDDKIDEIDETIKETLRKVVKEGLNKEELTASLNRLEFNYKERDFGGNTPIGLVFGLTSLNSWLYDGDPAQAIVLDQYFAQLREKIETNYFEMLIDQYILNSNHCCKVILKPSTKLEKQKEIEMNKKMIDYKSSLSQQQLEDLLKLNQQLDAWQASSDSVEVKKMLPHLQLSDIKEKPSKIEKEIENICGIDVIKYKNETNGIDYYKLYFDIGDFDDNKIQWVGVLSEVLSEISTKNYLAETLTKLKKTYLGKFNVSFVVNTSFHQDTYRSMLEVSYSCLDINKEKALEIVLEILYNTIFTDKEDILNILKQVKLSLQQSAIFAGHKFAITRAQASFSQPLYIRELVDGYSYYQFLKKVIDNLDIEQLEKVYQEVFTSNRLTISTSGLNQEMMVNKIIAGIKQQDGEIVTFNHQLLPIKKEGIVIASQVSYAILVTDLAQDFKDNRGRFLCTDKILSLDYLWNNIRAKNGAYGTGAQNNGSKLLFYSYRDPSANKSLEIYQNVPKYLEDFCHNDDDLTTYIIGAIGDDDPLLTNSSIMRIGDVEYFTGKTYQDKCEIRKQILTLNKDEIAKLIPIYSQGLQHSTICVVGPKSELDKIKGLELLEL